MYHGGYRAFAGRQDGIETGTKASTEGTDQSLRNWFLRPRLWSLGMDLSSFFLSTFRNGDLSPPSSLHPPLLFLSDVSLSGLFQVPSSSPSLPRLPHSSYCPILVMRVSRRALSSRTQV